MVQVEIREIRNNNKRVIKMDFSKGYSRYLGSFFTFKEFHRDFADFAGEGEEYSKDGDCLRNVGGSGDVDRGSNNRWPWLDLRDDFF